MNQSKERFFFDFNLSELLATGYCILWTSQWALDGSDWEFGTNNLFVWMNSHKIAFLFIPNELLRRFQSDSISRRDRSYPGEYCRWSKPNLHVIDDQIGLSELKQLRGYRSYLILSERVPRVTAFHQDRCFCRADVCLSPSRFSIPLMHEMRGTILLILSLNLHCEWSICDRLWSAIFWK